ncbi:hypothetical protein [Halorubrum halophilum]|uniref:hypothetical protein n=1 Tax=Halorubrum halophilum TaxID=413816 RepID=UPI00067944F1|nr:hypothetical protein [Halorubrum halophilum]
MIQTANGFFEYVVDDNYLDEIQADLNEFDALVGYYHNDLEGKVTMILKMPDIDTEIGYIH